MGSNIFPRGGSPSCTAPIYWHADTMNLPKTSVRTWCGSVLRTLILFVVSTYILLLLLVEVSG